MPDFMTKRDQANEPHDILAAEAFAMGEGDRDLHHEPAHDILAADEFPLPGSAHHAVPPDYAAGSGSGRASTGRGRRAPAAALMLAALWVLRRRRANR